MVKFFNKDKKADFPTVKYTKNKEGAEDSITIKTNNKPTKEKDTQPKEKEQLKKGRESGAQKIKEGAKEIFEGAKHKVGKEIAGVGTKIKNKIEGAGTGIKGTGTNIKNKIEGAGTNIKNKIGDIKELGEMTAKRYIKDPINKKIGEIKTTAGEMQEGAKKAAQNIGNAMKGLANIGHIYKEVENLKSENLQLKTNEALKNLKIHNAENERVKPDYTPPGKQSNEQITNL